MKIIYTTANCPGCKTLKAQWEAQGLVRDRDFKEIQIGRDISKEEFIDTFPGVRQVPHVVELNPS